MPCTQTLQWCCVCVITADWLNHAVRQLHTFELPYEIYHVAKYVHGVSILTSVLLLKKAWLSSGSCCLYCGTKAW
jgi:hypothetical protein